MPAARGCRRRRPNWRRQLVDPPRADGPGGDRCGARDAHSAGQLQRGGERRPRRRGARDHQRRAAPQGGGDRHRARLRPAVPCSGATAGRQRESQQRRQLCVLRDGTAAAAPLVRAGGGQAGRAAAAGRGAQAALPQPQPLPGVRHGSGRPAGACRACGPWRGLLAAGGTLVGVPGARTHPLLCRAGAAADRRGHPSQGERGAARALRPHCRLLAKLDCLFQRVGGGAWRRQCLVTTWLGGKRDDPPAATEAARPRERHARAGDGYHHRGGRLQLHGGDRAHVHGVRHAWAAAARGRHAGAGGR
mmetsp:Transcript_17436/g.54014  ORF Transcript_17436/g.54014 Transcript_17436/m.54014 type:complete len:304 (+) Transcript_17436:1427-2338(+)